MHKNGIAGVIWAAVRRLASVPGGIRATMAMLAVAGIFLGAASLPVYANAIITVNVTGDTAIAGFDGSQLFNAIPFDPVGIPTASGAFPYIATFTFDLSDVNLSSSTVGLPVIGDYNVSMVNATFNAFGQTIPLSGSSHLTLDSGSGTNFYSQQVSSGTTSLSTFSIPASGNVIANAGAATSFGFAATPYSLLTPDGVSRTTFTDGETSLVANVNSVSYSASAGCSAIVSGGVSKTLSGTSKTGQPYIIDATFTPNFGLSLSQAANDCGYAGFDWKSEIASFPSKVVANECADYSCATTTPLTSSSTPFNDPPLYGYSYCNPNSASYTGGRDCSTAFPFAYDSTNITNVCLRSALGICYEYAAGPLIGTPTNLNFEDIPDDPSSTGQALVFSTYVFGTTGQFDPAATTDCMDITPTPTCVELLGIGFNWVDTYNQSTITGGIFSGGVLPDGSGTGGITIIGGSTNVPEPPSYLILLVGMAVSSMCRLPSQRIIDIIKLCDGKPKPL